MKLGIYRLSSLLDEPALTTIQTEYGADFSILSFYRAWNRCSIEDDLPWLRAVMSSSKDILLTWEPWRIPPQPCSPENQSDFSLKHITSGLYDSYIKAFASTLALFRRTVFLRPMHEMNGFWYPWCGTVNRNNPEEFIQTWDYIKRLFREEGASNVRWVWSPYRSSHPDTAENSICSYFPGDDKIDIIALDGYNWGTSIAWGKWQNFNDLFGEAYDTITALSTKDLIIAETGCSESGGDKAKWISEMFSILPSRFERIKALVWFDIDKECDWRIASSESSLNAFRKGASGIASKHLSTSV